MLKLNFNGSFTRKFHQGGVGGPFVTPMELLDVPTRGRVQSVYHRCCDNGAETFSLLTGCGELKVMNDFKPIIGHSFSNIQWRYTFVNYPWRLADWAEGNSLPLFHDAFSFSHVYRESNILADVLPKYGVTHTTLVFDV